MEETRRERERRGDNTLSSLEPSLGCGAREGSRRSDCRRSQLVVWEGGGEAVDEGLRGESWDGGPMHTIVAGVEPYNVRVERLKMRD